MWHTTKRIFIYFNHKCASQNERHVCHQKQTSKLLPKLDCFIEENSIDTIINLDAFLLPNSLEVHVWSCGPQVGDSCIKAENCVYCRSARYFIAPRSAVQGICLIFHKAYTPLNLAMKTVEYVWKITSNNFSIEMRFLLYLSAMHNGSKFGRSGFQTKLVESKSS